MLFLYFAVSRILCSLYHFIDVLEAQMAVVDVGISCDMLFFLLGICVYFFTVSSVFSYYGCLDWWRWLVLCTVDCVLMLHTPLGIKLVAACLYLFLSVIQTTQNCFFLCRNYVLISVTEVDCCEVDKAVRLCDV